MDTLQRKIDLVVKNNKDVSLSQLEATLDLGDKLDTLTEAIKSIPEVEMPEPVEIPEFPSEMVISNLPEVQKVEITNLPSEKDDKKQLALLKEIASELKKKEQYTYDIEIDAALKEQLKGDKGEDGKNGDEITPSEIVTKLESLEGENRLDISAIKGWEYLKDKGTKIVGRGARLLSSLLDVFIENPTDGQGLVYSAATGKWINGSVTGGIEETFESVLRNLKSYPTALTYNADNKIETIVYTLPSGAITETVSYTGSLISSIVLSGSTPSGIALTKSFTYTGNYPTSLVYS